jgi:antitoxin component of RelBE/YafQ-DinJ toxin-antitoxin module
MNESKSIRVEIDHEQKERIESTLKGFGVSIRFAVQTFLHRIDRTGKFPFELARQDPEALSESEPDASAMDDLTTDDPDDASSAQMSEYEKENAT